MTTNLNLNTGVFTVGTTGTVNFDYLFDGGWFQGEVGIFSLEGMEQFTPGSEAYIQEAARRALTSSQDGYVVLADRQEGARFSTETPWEGDFNHGDYKGVKSFELEAGSQFAFIMTQHTSLAELAEHPERYTEDGKLPLFSIPGLNPDLNGADGVNQFSQLNTNGVFGFEATRVDVRSDRDYNDVVFQVTGAEATAPWYGDVRNPGRNFRFTEIGQQLTDYAEQAVANDGYLIANQSGEVVIDAVFDGGWFQGEVGIFNIEGLEDLDPRSLEFIQAAAERALSDSEQGYVVFADGTEGARIQEAAPWENNFNSGTYQGEQTFQLTPGGKYALVLVPNGTLQETAANPTKDGTRGKRPFFSLRTANLLDSAQAVQLTESSDEKIAIGFEDVHAAFGSDLDYNDFVLSVEGATFFGPNADDHQDPQYNLEFAPIAENDAELTFKDTAITISADSLLSNDYDLDGDVIDYVGLDSSNTQGLVSVVNGQITYDPNGQFDHLGVGESEVDSFTYTITDTTGKTDTATVNITIDGFSTDAAENNVGTLDTLHLLPPLYAQQDVRDHYLVLSTLIETPFEVTLQNAAGVNGLEGGINTTYTLSKDSPLILDLSGGDLGDGQGHASLGVIDTDQVGQVDSLEGLVVTGDQAFYANVRHQTKAQGTSLSSKGQLALGTEFRTGHLVTNTEQAWRKSHFISVIASEDDTTISFQDLPEGVTFINGHPGQVVLDQYESFVVGVSVQNNIDNPNALQGTLVVSDKPIAVNSGSWLAGTVGAGRDIGSDQLVPTNLLGSKYVLVKGEATTNADALERPIIIANQDNTEVFLNGSDTAYTTLQAGESLILEGNAFASSDTLLIETSNSAYVYQMSSANNRTAPGLSLAVPISEQAGNQEILVPSIDQLGEGKLNIVANASATVNIDGSALTGGVAVEGDHSLVVYQIEGLAGDVSITSDEAIQVTSTTGAGHIGAASVWSGLPTSLATNDVVSTNADTPITIDVLSNDLIIADFAPVGFPDAPEHGTAVINADNTITYIPNADFAGSDVFEYRGINSQGRTDTAVVTVNVDLVEVEGGIDDDTLIGSATGDRIVGYAGNDTITTGSGFDVLVYNSAGEGLDTITDFEVGVDSFDLTRFLGIVNPLDNGVDFAESGNDSILQYNGTEIAIVEGIAPVTLANTDHFVF